MLGRGLSAAKWRTSAALTVALAATALALSACTTTGFDGSSSALNDPSTSESPSESGQPEELVVLPVLTVASVDVDGAHVTLSGYVQGITEDGGTCRFTVSNDSTTVDVDSPGHADRSTTACELRQVDMKKLARGEWSVELEYHAADGTVTTSQPLSLEIP